MQNDFKTKSKIKEMMLKTNKILNMKMFRENELKKFEKYYKDEIAKDKQRHTLIMDRNQNQRSVVTSKICDLFELKRKAANEVKDQMEKLKEERKLNTMNIIYRNQSKRMEVQKFEKNTEQKLKLYHSQKLIMSKKNFEDKLEIEKKRILMKQKEVSNLEKLEFELIKRMQSTKLIHQNALFKLESSKQHDLPSFKKLKELKILKNSRYNYIKK